MQTCCTSRASPSRTFGFCIPDIVRAVVEDNEARRTTWTTALARRGIDPFLYLWERSPCAFPGVRCYAGATEIARYRRRQPLTEPFSNALDVDDNDHPKAIWSYVFRGRPFQKEGPSGYSLAHLADHKEYQDRGPEEFSDPTAPGNRWRTRFGLFTSVTNTVYTPDGLMRPTDFSFPLRNLIQRKADALYGRFCNLLPAPWSIRPGAEKTWSVEAFGWSEPVGGTEHVEPFLSYRNGRMEDLLSEDYLRKKYSLESK